MVWIKKNINSIMNNENLTQTYTKKVQDFLSCIQINNLKRSNLFKNNMFLDFFIPFRTSKTFTAESWPSSQASEAPGIQYTDINPVLKLVSRSLSRDKFYWIPYIFWQNSFSRFKSEITSF